jgi:hypothetical protein
MRLHGDTQLAGARIAGDDRVGQVTLTYLELATTRAPCSRPVIYDPPISLEAQVPPQILSPAYLSMPTQIAA